MRTLVTGGTRGIGAAVARRLAADGHDLVLGYARDDEAAERTARSCRELGVSCTTVRADLVAHDGIDELFAAAGELTGVVNNAGATLHIGPLADTPPDVVRATVDLNLTSALLVARAAVRDDGAVARRRGGVLVNVSSGAATLGAPGEYVQYAAAKAGVDALTIGLAQEVAKDGIRVVGVAPGIIETTIHADAGEPGRIDRVGPLVPLGRAGHVDEVAARRRLAAVRRGVLRHRHDACGSPAVASARVARSRRRPRPADGSHRSTTPGGREVLAGRVHAEHQLALVGARAELVGGTRRRAGSSRVARSTSRTNTSSKRSTKAAWLREPPQKKVTGSLWSVTSSRTRSTSQTWCSWWNPGTGSPVTGSPW